MTAALAYALRRTSARVVLAVGAFGLLWTVSVAEPSLYLSVLGKVAHPIPILRGPYRVLGWGLSPWDAAVAVLVSVVAVVAAAVLWRERSIGR